MALPAVTLEPGQYYLVQLAGGATGVPLPPADATGSINMAGGSGKVALVNSAASLGCNGGSTVCDAAQVALIVDLVGYGGANFSEGFATPALSNTTAAFRAGQGCTDTNTNGADFTIAPPLPRNLATPPAPCIAGSNPSINVPDVTGEAAQSSPVVVTAIVTPGTNPASATLVVTADLSTLGGTSFQMLTDDGVDPDAAAGDNVFTTSFFVDPTLSAGTYVFSARVADDQMRSATDGATLTLTSPPPQYLPWQIQGPDSQSALAGQLVAANGVVTARKFNGFFIQTPESSEDGDPNTSEGLFVFVSGGAPDSVIVGNLVLVTGTVAEFSPSAIRTAPR